MTITNVGFGLWTLWYQDGKEDSLRTFVFDPDWEDFADHEDF